MADIPASCEQTFQPQGKIAMLKKRFARFHWRAALLLLPFFVLFSLFQIAPMIWVLINSFIYEEAWSLGNYLEVFNNDFYLQAFENTLWLSIICSVIGLFISSITAFSIYKMQGKIRRIMISFTTMASNFSGVPLAFAFIIILGFNGAITLQLKSWGIIEDFNIYSASGLMLLYVYFQIPLGVLLLYPAFDALKPEWEDAAKTMGASKLTYWLKVAIPVLSPALLGTFIILIANAMGAYASTYALTSGNYNLVTIRIASLVSGDLFLEPNMAAALSMLLIAILAFITAIHHWLIKRSYHAK
ncbi:ABC transporter permease [Providencia hangzhouensis]|uniref:ABC transporter permease subunit n=1 Tax=Providencia rettgeri TaxID=587 RepID=A0AAE2ZB62_PRORE|nr:MULTISPECIES: ABC transporter permease subunit [Providencia]MRF68727.1 ABC transporter permease subunit [Escherichia coli]EFE51924.1 ABC transporter, permease protein [Providencia rettgeri DSM 1131]MBI6191453.1 ABC transporter permease subunit [Providencia rettgeri]MBW3116517.1 ABC transporter permease subunit [Providencia rettgeri]MCK9790459.1 ABC transporter permease subunit [Providencia rettgeri]